MLSQTLFPIFRSIILISGALIFALQGCHERKSNDASIDIKRAHEEETNPVDTAILKNGIFYKEILSNGKLKAVRKSELKFRVSGELQELLVKNGSHVKNGQLLARLNPFEYQQRLNQAETAIKNAALEMEDMLLGHIGLKAKDSISRAVKETFASKSGYATATSEFKTAQYNLAGTILRSPFSGKVANITYHIYEQVNPAEPFCIIIDDSEFEVEFYLIESEIHEVKMNDQVTIIPFSEDTPYTGYISEINPLIDENGLAFIKARIKNRGLLWEGMNVKVLIKKQVPDQLIVPKSSVVLRQNQEVLFKYVNGKAFWVYVQIGMENSKLYTVVPHPDKDGSLHAGDTIITSGNLNLAHESKISIR
jgi:RND family efflux transporter MFP subunit